jgi:hypothetical protein
LSPSKEARAAQQVAREEFEAEIRRMREARDRADTLTFNFIVISAVAFVLAATASISYKKYAHAQVCFNCCSLLILIFLFNFNASAIHHDAPQAEAERKRKLASKLKANQDAFEAEKQQWLHKLEEDAKAGAALADLDFDDDGNDESASMPRSAHSTIDSGEKPLTQEADHVESEDDGDGGNQPRHHHKKSSSSSSSSNQLFKCEVCRKKYHSEAQYVSFLNLLCF